MSPKRGHSHFPFLRSRSRDAAPVPGRASRQRGVALITAVLIVALATILATQLGFESALEQRRSIGMLYMDQAFQVSLGAEAWAAKYLRDDLANSPQTDNLSERWATPIPPIPLEGGPIEGSLEGQIEDLTGRFNLNNLINANGQRDAEGVRELKQLLTILELEPKWADIIADWIDQDTQPNIPDGGEDSLYLSQAPPYRSANIPITTTSEILAIPEFGLERYQRLAPYIAALPVGTKVNVCTASGVVLDALNEGIVQFSIDQPGLAKAREQGCFPTLQDYQNGLSAGTRQLLQNRIAEKTEYFGLRALVTLGTTEFSLYSLMVRDQTGVRVVMRTFGAE